VPGRYRSWSTAWGTTWVRAGSAPACSIAPCRADSETQITWLARAMPAGIARWKKIRLLRSCTSGMVSMVSSWNVTVAGTCRPRGSV
jgi:hypothetical protein